MKNIKLFEEFNLNEAIKPNEIINVGDDVIENPKMEGFGFEGKIGKVKKKNDSKDYISYLVKFGSKEQEYHDNEIVKAPKK